MHPDFVPDRGPLAEKEAVDDAPRIPLSEQVLRLEPPPRHEGGVGKARHQLLGVALQPGVDRGFHVQVEPVQVVEALDLKRLLQVDADPVRRLARGGDAMAAPARHVARDEGEGHVANEVGEVAIENPLAGEQSGVEVGAALQRVPILAQVAARRPNRAEERQDVLQGARPDRRRLSGPDVRHGLRGRDSEPDTESLIQSEDLTVAARRAQRNAVQVIQDDVVPLFPRVRSFLVHAQAGGQHLPQLVHRRSSASFLGVAVLLHLDREGASSLDAYREPHPARGIDEHRLRPAPPVDRGIAPAARALVQLAVLDEEERANDDRRDPRVGIEPAGPVRGGEEIAPVRSLDREPRDRRLPVGRRDPEFGREREGGGEAGLFRDAEATRLEVPREFGDSCVAPAHVGRSAFREHDLIGGAGLDVEPHALRPV